jgi:Tfp pilus assembly protein PilO
MQKTIITIVILLVAIAAIVMFVYPSFEKLRMTQATIEQKQQEAKELKEYVDQLQNIVYQLRGSQDQLAKINQSLLQSTYLPSAFQLVQSALSSSGVRIESIKLGKELPVKNNKNLFGQEVDLKFSGGYPALKSFLMSLENNSRLVLINNISFSQQEASTKLLPKIGIGIEIFSYSN